MSGSTMRYAITGAVVIGPEHELPHHAVIIDGEKIEAILPAADLPSDIEHHALDGGYLIPGIIDVHGHGAARHGFNEGTAEAFIVIGQELLSNGVTTALPTLASAPLEQLHAGIDALAAVQGREDLPHFPGIHFEGPYFAAAQRGAQTLADLRTPDDGSLNGLLERSESISMMSYAPELPGALALTERLVNANIVAAAGHSDGTEEDLLACQRAGLSHVIHIYSGQSTTKREGPWRIPGMLEGTLGSTGLTVEIIADGKHIPASLMRIAHRALGANLLAVSDATPGAGLPDGSTYRMGNQVYLVENGVGVTSDRTSFGGSTTLLPQMLPILLDTLEVTLPQAVAMITDIPAKAARLANIGRIAPGFQADLVHLNQNLTPRSVARLGQWRPTRPVITHH